jgi:hypothetical protein
MADPKARSSAMSNPSFIALTLTFTARFTQDQHSLKDQVKSAQDLVARLEAENYAREPQLKQIEEQYKQLQEKFERESRTLSNDALSYLEQEDARRGDKAATADYTRLRDAWRSFYGAQAANDPLKAPLLKAWVIGDPQHRKQAAEKLLGRPATDDELKDPDHLWADFQARQLKSEPLLRARITKLQKDSGFPHVLLEFVRVGALSKVTLDGVYFPYIQVKTPKELHDALFNLVKLKQQLTNSPAQ